ncbi:hypothetical protein L5186_002719 [Vibrio parahaemolyticus]|nr:hypothetical protein [Vibrio parahaemolyticus]EIU6754941.1 hypothetical protein [Vibrio parahaemolyticus]
MDLKNLEQRLEKLNEMRKQAANDPEFQELAKEHESSIKNEVEKAEALSREHGKRDSRKRKSKKAKSISMLGGSGIDSAIID